MLEMISDAFNWTARSVTKFETTHWVICFAILLTIGFICMRGLGVRGTR